MGREAVCLCRVDGKTYSVKALVESKQLIFLGELKRSIALSDIRQHHVAGEELNFEANGEQFSLHLGDLTASRWLALLKRPPVTLAEKLGLKGDAKVYVIGALEDEALLEAISGRQIDAAEHAAVCIVAVVTKHQLEAAIVAHQAASTTPLWIAYPKGKRSELSETAVRDTMRSRGYIDTKVSAVSERLTATRYNIKP